MAMCAVLAASLFSWFACYRLRDGRFSYRGASGGLICFVFCSFIDYYLVVTYSRGGYVAFLGGMVVLTCLSRKRNLIFPVTSFFVLLSIIPSGMARLGAVADLTDASIGNRLELWKGVLAMSADNWLSGVGFGFGGSAPFQSVFSAWYQPLWMKTVYNTAVNDYLTMSVKGGYPMLFGYLAICFCIIYLGVFALKSHGRSVVSRGKSLSFSVTAGLVAAQCAYMVAGVFSTFFLDARMLLILLVFQVCTIVVVIQQSVRTREWSFARTLYMAPLAAFSVCCVLYFAGVCFRLGIPTRYDSVSRGGVKLHVVTPKRVKPRGVVLYLFESNWKSFFPYGESLAKVARSVLRPMARKGFIVIASDSSGGFGGLRMMRLFADRVMEIAKRSHLPLMFTGQGEGGRFAIILASGLPDHSSLLAVSAIDSEMDYPFPKLSPNNYLGNSSFPLLLLYTDNESLVRNRAALRKMSLSNESNYRENIQFRVFDTNGSVSRNEIESLADFFIGVIDSGEKRDCPGSLIDYLDYENASQSDLRSADAVVFGGKICPKCDYLKKKLLPQLIAKANNGGVNLKGRAFKVISVDLEKPENVLLLMRFEELLGMKGEKTPVLLWNNKLYYGNESVSDLIAENDDAYAGNKKEVRDILAGTVKGDVERVLRDRAVGLSLPLIISAGLIDGINPCVFSTLIFFMSLLGVSKITGGKLFLTGIVYCSACFLTYLLLGFGVLHALKFFSGLSYMRMGVNYVTFILLLVCAFISFRDSWVFSRSGDPGRIKLQLPDVVKRKINLVFKRGMSFKYLIPGAFMMGFVVTLLESLCTGQVYVPIMVLLSKESYMSKWFFYLIIYNVMFILPLIAIFLMAYFGVTVSNFIKLSRRNVVLSKFLLGCLFCALAVLVLVI